MNVRALLHSVSAAAAAVAGGAVIFVGLPIDVMKDFVGVAVLTVIVIDTYLASTSTGVNAAGKDGGPS